ncbi:MAG: (2Fe-2S)-binding protein [Alphaproteobacteria bacterium]|nr:(2Fe-2S)-binding protein [Alphaproteobacteria bacterium]
MYVCNCNGLTQRQVREAISKLRPQDPGSIYRYYDCKPQCGRCVSDVRQMLIKERETEAA